MGKVNAAGNGELVARPKTEGRAGKIAETIDRNAGGFREFGNEKGRSQVGHVMLNLVELGLEGDVVNLLERVFNRNRAANIPHLLQHEFWRGPAAYDKAKPPQIVDAGFAI